MIRIIRAFIIVAFSCAIAAGCSESDQENPTGKATLVAINTIVGAPNVTFKIEERSLGTIDYGVATQLSEYDDLDYIFNFDASVPGESSARRLASQRVDVVADQFYLFALIGTFQDPDIILWQEDERAWDGTETVFELAFANLNNELPVVDVYFDAPGVAPAVGNEIGTLSLGDRIDSADYAAGEYVLTLTAPGDPQTVYFTSGTRTFAASNSATILFLDDSPSLTSNVTVVRVSASAGGSTQIYDERFPSRVRILHAANAVGNVDVAENSNFTPPLVENLGFGEITDDLALTDGTNTYTFTDTGNQGATIAESDFTIGNGRYQTFALVGPPGAAGIVPNSSERRPFVTSGRIGFVQVASAFEFVDLYLLEPGESVDDNNPALNFLPFGTPAPLVAYEAKDYELTVTIAGEKTIIAGPVPANIANGDVVEVFILETADPNTATILQLRY